jgi:O-antigen/teichoic acid export membrane protein/glycosyltransferase involved in cell wall biosynthesis
VTEASRQLDRSLARGIAWTGGVKWATQVISWGVTLVVARLLVPEDYGLFAMATVYMGIAQLVSEAGLMPVIIQPTTLDRGVAAKIGGLAIAVGLAVCLISVAMALPIAWFFREPRVRDVILVLSFNFVLRGVQVLPRGLLLRDLDFRRIAWLDAAESAGAAVATIALAMAGFGYWSLVGGAMLSLAVGTFIALRMRPHPVSFQLRDPSLKAPMLMGRHVLVSQMAWYVYSNADFAVVGRWLGKAALGTYGLAWTFAMVPVDRFTTLVGRVAAPVLSAVPKDNVALRRYICGLTEGLALVTMPACIGLALVADLLVRALLVPAWNGVVVPLRILALYAAVRCVTSVLSQVLIFTGNARRNMQVSVVAAISLTAGFIFASQWGLVGVASVWLVVYPTLVTGLTMHYALGVVKLRYRDFFAAMGPAALATAAMTAAVLGLRTMLPATLPALALLVIVSLGGAAVYAACLWLTSRERIIAAFRLLFGREKPQVGDAVSEGPPASAPSAEARLVLISWHFPPDPAVGALRWQKLATLAAERGWGVDVVMRDTTGMAGLDPSRVDELPASIRLHEVRLRPSPLAGVTRLLAALVRKGRAVPVVSGAKAPAQGSVRSADLGPIRSLRDVARAWHAWDEHARGARWAHDAAEAAAKLVQRGVHRMIISSGPPHWAHVAARSAAKRTGLPYAVDLRDPWSLIQRLPEHLASPVTLKLAARDEEVVVRDAALVVANTIRARDALRLAHPAQAERIIDVPNGFDEDPMPPSRRGRRFVVAYAGTIYLDRDPRPLCRAVARAVRARRLSPEDFALEFMGEVSTFDGMRLEDIAREEGVADFVHVRPSGTRREALEFVSGASMLVVLPQDSDMAIPAKLFEYMRFAAWVLVCGSPESATRAIVEGLDVDAVAPGDVNAMASVMIRRYDLHRRGVQAIPLARHAQLGRRARAAVLFDAIEAITGRPQVAERPAAPAETSPPVPAAAPRWPGATSPAVRSTRQRAS